ncbi:MAG: D-glycero-beta-D-manno-heptose-7-phosphate kinase [Deltaproteobacteria bacterium]|nr:D-glycero-beta-D-manno-heptose-7-phosphate kinase [Deltaproteobacteria bacterium]
MLKINKDRLKKILNSMRSKTLAVVGDLILDEYIWGDVQRISPEAPVPVVDVQKESVQLGGAGNVAQNLVSLGAKVILGGVVGEDNPGRIMLDLFRQQGISSPLVLVDPERDTSVKTRIIAHTQQVVRIDKEVRSLIPDDVRDRLINLFKGSINSIDAVIISDYGKGVVDKKLIGKVVNLASKNSLLVSVDPKERNFPFYRRVGLITPNIKELSYGASIPIKEDADVIAAARKVKSLLDCGMVLTTRGEKGMSLLDTDDKIIHIPTSAKAVYDVTGAGDTVIACFTLALVSGASSIEAAMISNIAAGLVVAEVGTASVARDRLAQECMEGLIG